MISSLRVNLEYLPYYIDEINKYQDKFRLELENLHGYVEEFSDYIKPDTPISYGAERLVLFLFFSKLDKGHFKKYDGYFSEFLKESEKVIKNNDVIGIEQYLEIDKIKEDFKVQD